MNSDRIRSTLQIGIVSLIVASGCYSQAVPGPIDAAYGTIPGRRMISAQNELIYVAESGFPSGVYAVPLNVKQALAFDTDGVETGICSRIDDKSFELNGNVKYYKFQCNSPLVDSKLPPTLLFVASTELQPRLGEKLEWQRLEMPLPFSSGEKPKNLHSYAAVAMPKLLNGKVLVSAAWFSGQYPPPKEPDILRDELMAFGHYELLDRAMFVGQSANQPATFLFQAKDPLEVREGLEWALLPEDSSEKTHAQVSSIYEIPQGYLLRVTQEHDHEGFGSDDSTYLYAYESGRWRLLATAERTRLY